MNFTHYIDEPENLKITKEMFDPIIPTNGTVLSSFSIKEAMDMANKLKALLTEEMVLQFLITGKNELQLVQQIVGDKIIIKLERIKDDK